MPDPTVPAVNLEGQVLANGRFLLQNRVGSGGMADVYRATDRQSNRDVAVKIPKPHVVADAEFVKRFHREVKTLATLKHPNITPLLYAGEYESGVYAVFPFLSGGSLKQRIAGAHGLATPPLTADKLSWLMQIAFALDYLHAQGLLHRDVKPDNILFDDQGTAYLGDFGIVRALDQSKHGQNQTMLTGQNMVLGTVVYMAPELIIGKKPFSGAVDQYSLAVTMYHALSGQQPFAGTPQQIMAKHMTVKAPSLAAKRPDLPKAITTAVRRGMAKKHTSRYPSCAAFAAAISAGFTTGETPSLPPPIETTPVQTQDNTVIQPAPAITKRARVERRPQRSGTIRTPAVIEKTGMDPATRIGIIIGVFGVVAVGLILLVIAMFRSSDEEPEAPSNQIVKKNKKQIEIPPADEPVVVGKIDPEPNTKKPIEIVSKPAPKELPAKVDNPLPTNPEPIVYVKATMKAATANVAKTAKMSRQYAPTPSKVIPNLKRGSFDGRTDDMKRKMLVANGGSRETADAVLRGLQWLLRIQEANGSWRLDGNYKDSGDRKDEVAATAFALLPLLGEGYTHLSEEKLPSPYNTAIRGGLNYLMFKQNKKTGNFGSSMYTHGLATIAVCEAYALSKDKRLKRTAEKAVDYVLYAQHAAGGWRYQPRQAGDLSVTGWQVAALKSAKLAGIAVPQKYWIRAANFTNSVMSTSDYGYGYTMPGSRPTLTAVGLLIRMHLQNWDMSRKEFANPVNRYLMSRIPSSSSNSPTNMYHNYYATQVLFHCGGKQWETWNRRMRDMLLRTQFTGTGRSNGSWSPARDSHGNVGGRLMTTCFALRTLQVYYAYVPYHYDQGVEDSAQLRMAANRP